MFSTTISSLYEVVVGQGGGERGGEESGRRQGRTGEDRRLFPTLSMKSFINEMNDDQR